MPMAAGQYIVAGHLRGGRDHIERHTVVRKDKGGWVYETIIIDRSGKTRGSQQLQGHEFVKRDGATVKVMWIKTLYDDGTVERQEVEIPDLGEYADIMGKFMPGGSKGTQEKAVELQLPVTVPAGIFKGTTVFTTEKLQKSGKFPKIYFYPDVPITGMVKMADENDNVLMELIDFGNNGKPTICTCTRADRHVNHSCGK